MKTRIEWLNELPDGYRERAVANCKDWAGGKPTDEWGSMGGALWGMCDWGETPEGNNFWSAVHKHYINNTPLPPIPNEVEFPSPEAMDKAFNSCFSRLPTERTIGNSEKPNTHEAVNSPKHYNVNDKEVWQMMIDVFGKEAFVNFCALNAFKYRMRAGHKGDAKEDIDKALWYEAKMKELRG